MKKINYSLIIGTLVLFCLLIMTIFPESFSEVNPYGKQYEKIIYEQGKFSGAVPPIAPCEEFPWGTDARGRDMKSLIIYGTKSTLLMALAVALGRLLISIPISILAAYKNKLAIWFIKQFNMIFTAFPLVLVTIILMNLGLFKEVFDNMMTPATLILITFGWAKVAKVITQKVEEVLNNDFIEGEIAIGKNKIEIAIQNIIPHIVPYIIVTLFLEVAMVLITLAQIGVMGTIINKSFFDAEGSVNTPLEFDWPTLLIFSYHFFGTDKIWLVLYPALAFSVSIIGFNLFGEGLKFEFEQKNSRIISTIKKIPYILSPSTYIYQIRNFKFFKSTVIRKTIICILIVSLVFLPKPHNIYNLDAQSAFNTIKELEIQQTSSINEYELENEKAQIIENKLKKSGVMPWEEKFLHPYEISTHKRKIESLDMTIFVDNKNLEIEYNKGCYIREFVPGDKVYDIHKVKFNESKNQIINIKETKEQFILVDARDIHINKLYEIILRSKIDPIGIIYVVEPTKEQMISYDISKAEDNGWTIMTIASDIGEKLLQGKDVKLKLNIKASAPEKKGINVLGYIPGTDKNMKDEYIVIGTSLDYVKNNTISGVSILLQIAEDMIKNNIKSKRTVIFAFWGGGLEDDRGSKEFVNEYLKYSDKNAFYIDLKDIANGQSNGILVDTSLIKPKSINEQDYIKVLKKYSDINNIGLMFGSASSPYSKDFYSTNMNAMVISSPMKIKSYFKSNEDTTNIINKKKYNRAGQMIFNAVSEIALGGKNE